LRIFGVAVQRLRQQEDRLDSFYSSQSHNIGAYFRYVCHNIGLHRLQAPLSTGLYPETEQQFSDQVARSKGELTSTCSIASTSGRRRELNESSRRQVWFLALSRDHLCFKRGPATAQDQPPAGVSSHSGSAVVHHASTTSTSSTFGLLHDLIKNGHRHLLGYCLRRDDLAINIVYNNSSSSALRAATTSSSTHRRPPCIHDGRLGGDN